MSTTVGGGLSSDGNSTDPVGHARHIPVVHGSGPGAPTVLPLPSLVTEFLEPGHLRRLNEIQLTYARDVAAAQLRAYEELLRTFCEG